MRAEDVLTGRCPYTTATPTIEVRSAGHVRKSCITLHEMLVVKEYIVPSDIRTTKSSN